MVCTRKIIIVACRRIFKGFPIVPSRPHRSLLAKICFRKFQKPSTKFQSNLKYQRTKLKQRAKKECQNLTYSFFVPFRAFLGFALCDLFGVWNLLFGICIGAGDWCSDYRPNFREKSRHGNRVPGHSVCAPETSP